MMRLMLALSLLLPLMPGVWGQDEIGLARRTDPRQDAEMTAQGRIDATHEHLVMTRRSCGVDERGRILAPGTRFIDYWLRDRLLAMPDIARVSLIDRLVSTSAFTGKVKEGTKTRPAVEIERWLRVDGSHNGVAAARDLIRKTRALSRRQMQVRTWIVSGKFKDYEPGLRYVDAEKFKLQIAAVKSSDAKGKAVRKKLPILGDLFAENATVITAPSLITNLGEEASVSIMKQISYIKDYKITTLENSTVADPVIDVVSDGIEFKVAGIVDPRGEKLTVMLDLKASKVKLPIAVFKTKLAGMGEEVSIQLPEVASTSVVRRDITFDGNGGTFVVDHRIPSHGGQSKMHRIFVEVTLIGPSVVDMGTVMGVDRRANRAFVDLLAEAKEGRKVAFWRQDTKVGNGIIDTVGESFAVIQVKDGSPKAGDTVR
ncbi:MAG: hypothetical protein V3W41_02110 [Planctomycetota bacterium]